MSLDPCDRVLCCIEDRLGTTKYFGGDVVFVELVDVTRKELLSHVL